MATVWPRMTHEQFFMFCQAHRDMRIERSAQGEVCIMPPTGGDTGNRNAALTTLLTVWSWQDGTGETFDSSTGFDLPNGATRSPDAAWIQRARLQGLAAAQRARFVPLCPDFVAEILSPSDSLSAAQDKMQEYMAHGARLGWLLDPERKKVYVYTPDKPCETLDNPSHLSGEPVLPGFVLPLRRIWQPGFRGAEAFARHTVVIGPDVP